MTLKLCPLIEYYIRNIFMEKICRKCAPKVSHKEGKKIRHKAVLELYQNLPLQIYAKRLMTL